MISKRLKELRNQKGVLQKDVATFLGITGSAYGFYEQGKRFPEAEILNKLADYYRVSIDYLMGREGAGPSRSAGITPADMIDVRDISDADVAFVKFMRRAGPELTDDNRKALMELAKVFLKQKGERD